MVSQQGHLEVVKELLKAGADPTLAVDNGATALWGARHFGHTRIAQLLREHGAALRCRDEGQLIGSRSIHVSSAVCSSIGSISINHKFNLFYSCLNFY